MGGPRRARRRRDATRGRDLSAEPGAQARLILLNGLPATGKSTLAARYAADRAGVLCVDPDLLRPQVEADPASAVERARALALQLASAHLRTGHDVVVAQLVADVGQVERFASAAQAAGARLVHLELVDRDGVRAELRGPEVTPLLDGYRRGLEEVRRRHPRLRLIASHSGDPDRTYAELVAVLDQDRDHDAEQTTAPAPTLEG